MLSNRLLLSSTVLLSLFVAVACSNEENPSTQSANEVVLKNQSVTPALAKAMPGVNNVEIFSLVGSDDKLDQSPNFVFGGSADGAGMLKNADGTFTLLVNHEDNFAVSRITLDKTFKPVKGEYILNSDGGVWRLCSATMATAEEHGFGPLYLTCGESGQESRTHGVNPFGDVGTASVSKEIAGLGRWSAENAVPLPKQAYAGKTAILIGDDDSDVNGGQLALYLSNTVGDLDNGSLYMLKRTDGNQREMDMKVGARFPVEFVRIDNHKTLTGAQINAKVNDLKAIKFGRVEDIDYRKKSTGREVYFNVTGQATSGPNADYARSKYGRVYRLTMDAADPLKATLEVVLDGDDRAGNAKTFQNVDNIVVTENYLYTQEDPNSYGDETHDSYIYQLNLKTNEFKPVIELDHRRTASDAAKYNVGGASRFGAWEYGAMIDVSDQVGFADTFIIAVQPHTWRGDKYKAVDGGTKRPDENQASQLIVVKGLPR
ncbi:hypothetical protein EQG79_10765 [Spirosoma sordidisoli]|uniref:DUF839 domain-containing protein n=1 Tax=Spirosoma sordidisoli TaxID=2502893 RepID=A0A4Q2ULV8_9BACT|nr:hypothetical protein EQG79_10765 [Spirosoma sordidisoli]